MDLQGKKFEAQFQFGFEGKSESFTKPQDGVFHLFEHPYLLSRGTQITFWYGVADIAFTPEEITLFGEEDAKPGFVVRVQLEDGRAGMTRYLGGALAGNYFSLALSGFTALSH